MRDKWKPLNLLLRHRPRLDKRTHLVSLFLYKSHSKQVCVCVCVRMAARGLSRKVCVLTRTLNQLLDSSRVSSAVVNMTVVCQKHRALQLLSGTWERLRQLVGGIITLSIFTLLRHAKEKRVPGSKGRFATLQLAEEMPPSVSELVEDTHTASCSQNMERGK